MLMTTVLEYLVLVAFFVGMMVVGHIGLQEMLVFPQSTALYYGLKAAWERGHKDVICYSDSTLTAQLVSTMTCDLLQRVGTSN